MRRLVPLLALLVVLGCAPRDAQVEMREWAVRTGTEIAPPEEVEASFATVPVPERPAPRPQGPWPADMRGIAHDYVWTEHPPQVVQRVLYARRRGRAEAPVSDWAGDPTIALLLLTGDRDCFKWSAPYVAMYSAVAWQPGESVADVGTGVGPLAFMLWKDVAQRGRGDEVLYAEDVNPRLLEFVRYAGERLGCGDRLRTILGTSTDPKLPPQSVDVIVLAHVYHWVVPRSGKGSPPPGEVDEAVRRVLGPFMANLDAALRPGGRLVIIGNHGMLTRYDHQREILDLLGYGDRYAVIGSGDLIDPSYYLVLSKKP